jgi:hypothetical protein
MTPPASPTPNRHAEAAGSAPAPSLGRGRFAARAAVVAVAITISAIMAVVLASRLAVRWDLTATREHQLSPQTKAVLARLDRGVDVVIAADLASLDKATRQRTLDVLDKFAGAGDRVRVTTIDTGSPAGLAEYDQFLRRLAERSREPLERASAFAKETLDLTEAAAGELDRLSAGLAGVGELVPAGDGGGSTGAGGLRGYFEAQSAAARIMGEDLRQVLSRARPMLSTPGEGLPVAPVDEAWRSVRGPLNKLASDLGTLSGGMDAFAKLPPPPAAARERAAALSASIAPLRDALARQVLKIDQATVPGILSIARTIQRSRAALVLADPSAPPAPGRPTVTAIDTDALLPVRSADGPTAPDARARTEELIAGAIAQFAGGPRPLVVVTHAEPRKLAPDFASRRMTFERLRLLGIDVGEWAVVMDEKPPADVAAALGNRPVVFVSTGVEVNSPEAAARMGRLARVLAQLTREGRSVLLSVNLSTLPGSGAPDPMVEFLEPLGLKASSGLALLEEFRAQRRLVSPEQEFADPHAKHPVSAALRGLRTFVPWPVPLRISFTPPEGVSITPVITLPSRESLWASAEWLGYRQTPAAQRRNVMNPPVRNNPGDDLGGSQPWTIAAAVQRTVDGATQRLLVVGSEGWFIDALTMAKIPVDGREAYAAPGNFELLAGGVWWLAGLEDRMGQTAASSAAPTIPALSPVQISVLRWVLIAGLPVGVLLLGALWRILRG